MRTALLALCSRRRLNPRWPWTLVPAAPKKNIPGPAASPPGSVSGLPPSGPFPAAISPWGARSQHRGAMFVQRLNALTGQPEWVVVGGPEEARRSGTDSGGGDSGSSGGSEVSGGSGSDGAGRGHGGGRGGDRELDEDATVGAVVATSGYLDMLNDRARAEAYARALARVLRPGDSVRRV